MTTHPEHRLLHRAVLVRQRRLHARRSTRRRLPRRARSRMASCSGRRMAVAGCCRPMPEPPSATSRRTATRTMPKRSIPTSTRSSRCPGKPLQFITGSDGGVVRSDGKFADISAKCDTRGLNAADTALCKSLLSKCREPAGQHEQRPVSTLQFQSLSASAQRPQNLLQGGTQDNGTFQVQWARPSSGPRRSTGTAASPASTPQRCAALQHVHRPGKRRELPRRRPDEVGDYLGADLLEPGRIVLLPAGHRRPESGQRPARSSRVRSRSGGRRTGVAIRPISKPTVRSSRRSPARPAAVISFQSATAPRRRSSPRPTGGAGAAARWPGSRGLRKTRARCGQRRARAACSSPRTRTIRPGSVVWNRVDPSRGRSQPVHQRDLRRSDESAIMPGLLTTDTT